MCRCTMRQLLAMTLHGNEHTLQLAMHASFSREAQHLEALTRQSLQHVHTYTAAAVDDAEQQVEAMAHADQVRRGTRTEDRLHGQQVLKLLAVLAVVGELDMAVLALAERVAYVSHSFRL